jgi:hypothetical protein
MYLKKSPSMKLRKRASSSLGQVDLRPTTRQVNRLVVGHGTVTPDDGNAGAVCDKASDGGQSPIQ